MNMHVLFIYIYPIFNNDKNQYFILLAKYIDTYIFLMKFDFAISITFS